MLLLFPHFFAIHFPNDIPTRYGLTALTMPISYRAHEINNYSYVIAMFVPSCRLPHSYVALFGNGKKNRKRKTTFYYSMIIYFSAYLFCDHVGSFVVTRLSLRFKHGHTTPLSVSKDLVAMHESALHVYIWLREVHKMVINPRRIRSIRHK